MGKSTLRKIVKQIYSNIPDEPVTANKLSEKTNMPLWRIKNTVPYMLRQRILYKLEFNTKSVKGNAKYSNQELFNKNGGKTFYATSPFALTKLFFESINTDNMTPGKRHAHTHLLKNIILPLWRNARGGGRG